MYITYVIDLSIKIALHSLYALQLSLKLCFIMSHHIYNAYFLALRYLQNHIV